MLNPYLHAHLVSCALVELRDSTRDCFILPNMTYNILTFQLSNSEEQFGNLYDIAFSTLLSSPLGSVWVDLLSKLTLYLIDDFDLDKRGHFRWIYVCVLVGFDFYYSTRQHKCHFEKVA